MNKKRVFFVFAFSLIALIVIGVLVSNFASAYYFPSARQVSQNVITAYIDVFEPILQALFGGYGGWSGYLLFERFLLFVVLVSIVYLAIGRVSLFENQKTVKWIVSVIVPLIGMRYINYDSLSAIITQYQVLAIAITSVLPFIIFFFFVHNISGDYPILRQIGWIFFIVVYLGLWSTTQNELSSQIYFWTVAVSLFCLFFDKRIENWFRRRLFARGEEETVMRAIADTNEKIGKIRNQIESGYFTDKKAGEKIIKGLEAHIAGLKKRL